jgi:hypothetical protein
MSARLPISFASALAHFKAQCAQFGELDLADRDHLARWVDDDRAETVWQKIQNFAWGPVQGYDPIDGFIVSVLVARRIANAIPTLIHADERRKRLSARCLERAHDLDALAKTWKEIGNCNHPNAKLALTRAKKHEAEAELWRKFARRPPRKRPFLISRVDRSRSQQQRAFMQLVSKYMIDVCGRPLDDEVAVLNDIASGTSEATSVFQARSARRQTTRTGRRSAAGRSRRKSLVKKLTKASS